MRQPKDLFIFLSIATASFFSLGKQPPQALSFTPTTFEVPIQSIYLENRRNGKKQYLLQCSQNAWLQSQHCYLDLAKSLKKKQLWQDSLVDPGLYHWLVLNYCKEKQQRFIIRLSGHAS